MGPHGDAIGAGMQTSDMMAIRDRLHQRRRAHREAVWRETKRLTLELSELGVQRVVLFGSAVRRETGLTSDLDLLVVWDTPLDFVTRTAELYGRLAPRVASDILVYTPAEMERMAHTPFVRGALEEGEVLYEA